MLRQYGAYKRFLLWGRSIVGRNGQVVSIDLQLNIMYLLTTLRYSINRVVFISTTAPFRSSLDMLRHVPRHSAHHPKSHRSVRRESTTRRTQTDVC